MAPTRQLLILIMRIIQGELAIVFGELLRKLWSSGQTSVAPRAFKAKLAQFAPQFSGYNQHDSQVGDIIITNNGSFSYLSFLRMCFQI